MDAFDPEMYPDTVNVYPRADTTDVDSGDVPGFGTPVAFAASVQRVTAAQDTRRGEPTRGGIEGEARYDVLFPTDPAVSYPDTKIVHTASAMAGTFATPIVLLSMGSSEPPSGLLARWTVACRRIS